MVILTPTPKQQIFGSDGKPLVGGKIYTYAAGTTTPLATYTDAGGGTANTNPIVLNSIGQADIWLTASSSYKFSVYTSTDVLLYTVDNITAPLDYGSLTAAFAAPPPIGNTTPNTGAFTTVSASVSYQFPDGNLQLYPSVPVRQTVLSGPIDANGFASFGGSTGSAVVTAAGTLICTASNATTNRTGSITNPSWTSLSTNGTMYLFLDIAANGTCTPSSTTLAPTYQWGGTYSTSALQNTFNIQEMTMKVGDGSAANQVYRVFVGEVTVSGGVTTAITWYALMGRYRSADVACSGAGAATTFSHNIGVTRCKMQHFLVCFSATGGWSVGDTITNVNTLGGANYLTLQPRQSNRNTSTVTTASTNAYVGLDPSNGNITNIGSVNFNQFLVAERGW